MWEQPQNFESIEGSEIMTKGFGNYFFSRFVKSRNMTAEEAEKLRAQAIVEYDKLMLQVHVACENTWEPLATILTARHLVDSFNSKSANT